jgi:predicted phage baseplate assembly protein
MPLPVPNLDDRRFQDLVDEAKRRVQVACPEWSDHNVHDPGVTLIELFAWVTDQLVYRLNRVPDRNYIKFLELIGVALLPATAARADVTFWLSAVQPAPVQIEAGTQVATARTEREEPVVFTVVEPLTIPPCSVQAAGSIVDGQTVRDQTPALSDDNAVFACFDQVPKPDDQLLIGLDTAVPSCAVAVRLNCHVEGSGIDPDHPPLRWEAWTGQHWSRCEVERDETKGFNTSGDVVLHVPRGHTSSSMGGRGAAWLRCRVVPAYPGQPVYSKSPRIRGIKAFTVGGTAPAVHAEIIENEDLGRAEGVPGQRIALRHRPVVPSSTPAVLEVATDKGWEEWQEVPGFAGHKGHEKIFDLDHTAGEVVLGPAVRQADGTMRGYGATPPKGAQLRLRAYRTGGGRRGNVARGMITVLKSSVPFVRAVTNRRPAAGGVEPEEIENAKVRGPIVLRTGDRAVTAEDYEELARHAAPEVARVRCAAAGDGADPGAVRVLVVPAADDDELGRLAFEQLIPSDEALAQIAEHLEERRVIGARVVVEPPSYQAVTVVAKIRARPRFDQARLRADALAALYRYFHPIKGGPDGEGWPFGRPIQVGEVYAVLQRLPGTELVEQAHLFGADPVTGERGERTDRIELDRHALAFSFEHRVAVTRD